MLAYNERDKVHLLVWISSFWGCKEAEIGVSEIKFGSNIACVFPFFFCYLSELGFQYD
jgi:hypothetical protein